MEKTTSSTLEDLQRELEEERVKRKMLKAQLERTAQEKEDYVWLIQKKMLMGGGELASQLKNRLKNIQKVSSNQQKSSLQQLAQKQEEDIVRMLQIKLARILQEKSELEAKLECEQDILIQNLSCQMAKAIAEKL